MMIQVLPIIKNSFKSNTGTRSSIVPFTEKPSRQRMNDDHIQINDEINGAELFSLFTANIIKEKVIFTR